MTRFLAPIAATDAIPSVAAQPALEPSSTAEPDGSGATVDEERQAVINRHPSSFSFRYDDPPTDDPHPARLVCEGTPHPAVEPNDLKV